DTDRLRDLARDLSEDLHVAAIAFMVHDSDFACYWLFDNGRVLDEYNSCPDYFGEDDEDDGPARPSSGRPDVLLRYCRAGVRQEELAATLSSESVFAEDVIERLAQALGIDPQRALTDFRDVASGEGMDDGDVPGDDEDDDEPGGGPNLLSLQG